MENADYLIVGDGKTAKHISYYFELLDIPFNSWNRKISVSFNEGLKDESKVLLLISDDQIEKFIETNNPQTKREITWIHFAGALSTELAESAHPLMTFHDTLYDLETYKSISFVTEKGRKNFKELFPELSNKSFEIESSQKSLYHAWCSIAGNFTSILWSEFFERLENEFHIPEDAAFSYLKRITENIMKNPNAVTGPIIRGDKKTINKHLNALKDDEFLKVYESFLSTKSATSKVSEQK